MILNLDPILPRQLNPSYNVCLGGVVGTGECLPASQCVGIVYPGQCRNDPVDYTCCFHRKCNVSQGGGYCRDAANQTCEDGAYFIGTGYPWPCPGPNNIQCCVKNVDLFNSSTATTKTGVGTDTSTSTPTSTPTSSSSSSSKGQIGGIVGGVVGAVALVAGIAFLVWFRRRRRRAVQMDSRTERDTTGAEDPGKEDDVKVVDKDIPMLGGRMRQEMDAEGSVVHEMGESGMAGEAGVTRRGGLSELPGRVVAELPGSKVL